MRLTRRILLGFLGTVFQPSAALAWRQGGRQAVDGTLLDGTLLPFKSHETTGSMSARSNSIVVASNPGFQVGDRIIVETGGEAGAGARGTKGVGGVWPALSYANAAAMNADNGQATNTYAHLVDTGNTYQWSGTAWVRPLASQWYIAKAIPKALVTTITAISGTTFTLAARAAVATAGASVYYDNAPVFNAIAARGSGARPHNDMLAIPAGTFAIGSLLWMSGHHNWTIKGAGRALTTLFSPRGAPSASLIIAQSDNITVRDFHLRGNARQQGFALSAAVTETSVPQGEAYPPGVLFSSCTGGTARNLRITDVFQHAVGTSYCVEVWAHDCECILTEPLRQYVQWMFLWADSAGGGFADCSIDSAYLTAGFEIFRSDGVSMIRPRGRNAAISVNASGEWLIDAPELTIEANSQFDANSFSASNPLVNVNANIKPPSPNFARGGTIRNPTIVQRGHINANKDSLIGIVINTTCENVSITGTYPHAEDPRGYIDAPDYAAPSTKYGATGIVSDVAAISVSGVRVKGTARGYTNIHAPARASTVSNCVADAIVCSNQTNSQTNAAFCATRPRASYCP